MDETAGIVFTDELENITGSYEGSVTLGDTAICSES